MKRSLALLLAALLLAACGSNTILDEQRTFDGTWNSFNPEVFDVDIDDADGYYHITFEVVVDTPYMRGDGLPMLLRIESPNGSRRTMQSGVDLKQNGRWKGEAVDDSESRRISQRVKTFFSFNTKGTHRMEVSQATSQYNLEGVRSLRVKVEKAPLEYPE